MELVVTGAGAPSGRDLVVETLMELSDELKAGNDWENGTLDRYLDALAALLGSIENVYINVGESVPENPWILISRALRGARYYE